MIPQSCSVDHVGPCNDAVGLQLLDWGTAVPMTAFLVTLLLSLVLPFAVRPLLVRLGIMDVPNERSSHERPVLRGLGLAVLIAMTAGGILAVALFAMRGWPGHSVWDVPVVVLGASLLAGLLGLAEDLHGISVPLRSLLLLLIAAGSATGLLLTAPTSELAFGGSEAAGWYPGLAFAQLPAWVLVLLGIYAVFFISSYINVANFMDGLNGISGFHGVIAGLTFAAAGGLSGMPWLAAAGLILAAGFGGFLPWNLSKRGAFLGDVGSYLRGGAVAVTRFAALVSGVPILATIGPMVIYFGDVGVTLFKRVRAGHKWDEPHKEHVYQLLQQEGRSHVAASGINAAFTAAASILGLVSFFVPPIWWLALLVGGLGLVVVYVRLPKARPVAE